jgi:hypothetical protein
VVVAFTDFIDVRNGTTGAEIWSQPFNATQPVASYNVTQLVTDLLCTEDYTGDGFPDIVAGTDGGFLMIINGQNGTLFQESAQISHTLSYIQYMYSYENGIPLLNKTLAVSIEASSGACYVCGVNASALNIMKESSGFSFQPANLVSIPNSTSYTGDLLFSVGTPSGSTVYFVSGTDIVFSEFPLQIMLVIVFLTLWISIVISKRHKLRIK